MRSESLVLVGLAILSGLAGFSASPLSAQTPATKPPAGPDRTTPEAAVKSFAAAFSKGQVSQAATCVDGKPTSEIYKIWDATWQKSGRDAPSLTLSNFKTKPGKADTATVSYTLVLAIYGAVAKSTFNEQVNLRKAADGWLIVPLSLDEFLKRTRASAETEQLRQLATLAVHPELVSQGLAKGHMNDCRSNLRQVSTAALMLAAEKNDILKLSPERMQETLLPYMSSKNLFRCPGDFASAAGASSYTFNRALQNVNLANLKSAERVVMFYEGAEGKLNYRHDGKAMVAFADGQVTMLDAASARTLIWKP